MKKNKGCLNPECSMHKKKTMFESAYIRCPECGDFLSYVCKDCYMKLPNGGQSLCLRCYEKRKAKKEKAQAIAGSVFTGAVAIGATIIKKGPTVITNVVKTIIRK